MRRFAALTLLILIVPAAGCLSLGDDDATQEAPAEDTPPDASQDPTTLAFESCHEQVGTFTLSAEAYHDRLPPGFEPQGMDPGDETALVTLFTWRCENVLVDEQPTGPVTEMVGTLNVNPPPELEGQNASAHVVILHGVTDSEPLKIVYDAWGLHMEKGEVTMATEEPIPGTVRSGHATSTASFETVLNTNVAGPVEDREAGEARFFGVMDAELTSILDGWWRDVPNMQQGEATLIETHPDAVSPASEPLEGLGFHYWGDGFGFGYERVNLDAETS